MDTIAQVQKYLGLHPYKGQVSIGADGSSSTTEPLGHMQLLRPSLEDVVFIAIDFEAQESPPHHITEVGLATLDTCELHNVLPNRVGVDWHKFVRARHFRITEYHKHVNYKFVRGCPERFEFGSSEFVDKINIPAAIESCFREPFSAKDNASAQNANITAFQPRRNIVLVGHNLRSDINYCQSIGLDLVPRHNIIATVDTAALDSAYMNRSSTTSLSNVLYFHEIDAWNPHNAGNDAVYTIQAMLAICVAAAVSGL